MSIKNFNESRQLKKQRNFCRAYKWKSNNKGKKGVEGRKNI